MLLKSLWSEDMSNWQDLQFDDIYTYPINTEGCYTKEKIKAYKFLEAYNYFYNGYVCTVYFYCMKSLAFTGQRYTLVKGLQTFVMNNGQLFVCRVVQS